MILIIFSVFSVFHTFIPRAGSNPVFAPGPHVWHPCSRRSTCLFLCTSASFSKHAFTSFIRSFTPFEEMLLRSFPVSSSSWLKDEPFCGCGNLYSLVPKYRKSDVKHQFLQVLSEMKGFMWIYAERKCWRSGVAFI